MEKLDDILTGSVIRLQTIRQGTPPRLFLDRHPIRDFFVADLLDWAVKADRASMEHPMFSLSKKPDHRVRHYERNDVHVTIKPGADGMVSAIM